MVPDFPEPPPFVAPTDREEVTRESSPGGDDWLHGHNDREWIAYENQGGGHVPADHEWTSNPKQYQDDLGAK